MHQVAHVRVCLCMCATTKEICERERERGRERERERRDGGCVCIKSEQIRRRRGGEGCSDREIAADMLQCTRIISGEMGTVRLFSQGTFSVTDQCLIWS